MKSLLDGHPELQMASLRCWKQEVQQIRDSALWGNWLACQKNLRLINTVFTNTINIESDLCNKIDEEDMDDMIRQSLGNNLDGLSSIRELTAELVKDEPSRTANASTRLVNQKLPWEAKKKDDATEQCDE